MKHAVYLSQWLNSYPSGRDNLVKALEAKGFNPVFLDDTKLNDRERWTGDVWARDYMPIQIDSKTLVTYNYRPNYLTRDYLRGVLEEKKVEEYIDSRTRTEDVLIYVTKHFPDYEIRHTDLVLDGGNVVLCGDEAVILTNKVFSENQNLSQKEVLDELKKVFPGKHVIIIPWIQYPLDFKKKKEFLTEKEFNQIDHYGHADGFIQYIGKGEVLLYTDREGEYPQPFDAIKWVLKENGFTVHELNMNKGGQNSWCYINFLRVSDGDKEYIFMPKTKCEADFLKAYNTISKAFEGKVCEIVPVDLGSIPDKGGVLHCITWEVY